MVQPIAFVLNVKMRIFSDWISWKRTPFKILFMFNFVSDSTKSGKYAI